MTDTEYEHTCRMVDEGEVVEVIEVSDEEVAAITANEILRGITSERGAS